jgi:L-amino acid N-acyltransferase YncA
MEKRQDFQLRDATDADMAAVAGIYEHYVRTTCFSFEETPPSGEEMVERFHKVRDAGMPYLVAVDGQGIVVGYAYAAPYHARSAYRFTVENSVYVMRERLRHGVGFALMQKLIAECTARGSRQMIAVIAGSEASVALHARLGFEPVGTMTDIGFKLGQWVNVTYMQLALPR